MLSGDGLAEDEVGEGWLVLASECALAQIEAAFGSMPRRSVVIRRHVNSSKTIESMAFS